MSVTFSAIWLMRGIPGLLSLRAQRSNLAPHCARLIEIASSLRSSQ